KASLFIALVSLVLIFENQSNLRYLYPALLLAMLPAAYALAELRSQDARLYRAICLASVAIVALNVYFLPASNWHHKGFYLNPLSAPREAEAYLAESAPGRR